MAGLSTGADQWVVRGNMEDGSFSVYHFKGSHLIAVDSVNSVKDHVQARKLLDSGVSPTMAQVANAEFGLGA
jgi:3-phenylpropionate/trans-cinnamate dioxygenase ferredoxin reductase subunit